MGVGAVSVGMVVFVGVEGHGHSLGWIGLPENGAADIEVCTVQSAFGLRNNLLLPKFLQIRQYGFTIFFCPGQRSNQHHIVFFRFDK